MRRVRRRRWWCVGAAALLVAACSGGDDPPALADALADRDDLDDATAALFGDEGDAPNGDDLQGRAAEVGERIAESVEATETPLDAEAVDRYRETMGAWPSDQVGHIAGVLGHTRAVLAPGTDDEERTAYALRLGWTLADRFASGDDRLGWVVTEAVPIEPDDRSELIGHLDDGDDVAAAQLVVGLSEDDNPGVVVDAIQTELGELIPVEPGGDLLTILHTVYGTTSSDDGT